LEGKRVGAPFSPQWLLLPRMSMKKLTTNYVMTDDSITIL